MPTTTVWGVGALDRTHPLNGEEQPGRHGRDRLVTPLTGDARVGNNRHLRVDPAHVTPVHHE